MAKITMIIISSQLINYCLLEYSGKVFFFFFWIKKEPTESVPKCYLVPKNERMRTLKETVCVCCVNKCVGIVIHNSSVLFILKRMFIFQQFFPLLRCFC